MESLCCECESIFVWRRCVCDSRQSYVKRWLLSWSSCVLCTCRFPNRIRMKRCKLRECRAGSTNWSIRWPTNDAHCPKTSGFIKMDESRAISFVIRTQHRHSDTQFHVYLVYCAFGSAQAHWVLTLVKWVSGQFFYLWCIRSRYTLYGNLVIHIVHTSAVGRSAVAATLSIWLIAAVVVHCTLIVEPIVFRCGRILRVVGDRLHFHGVGHLKGSLQNIEMAKPKLSIFFLQNCWPLFFQKERFSIQNDYKHTTHHKWDWSRGRLFALNLRRRLLRIHAHAASQRRMIAARRRLYWHLQTLQQQQHQLAIRHGSSARPANEWCEPDWIFEYCWQRCSNAAASD